MRPWSVSIMQRLNARLREEHNPIPLPFKKEKIIKNPALFINLGTNSAISTSHADSGLIYLLRRDTTEARRYSLGICGDSSPSSSNMSSLSTVRSSPFSSTSFSTIGGADFCSDSVGKGRAKVDVFFFYKMNIA